MNRSLLSLISILTVVLVGSFATPAPAAGEGGSPEPQPPSEAVAEPAPSAPSPSAPDSAVPVPPTASTEAPPAHPAEAAPESPVPSGSQAQRPDLPAIQEDAALETVRDGRALSPAAAANTVTSATLEILRALETRHASVVTVRGTFDQLKVSEIFLEEIKSKGTFWFKKPDQFRCDYEPPDEMTNLILRDSIYVYVPSIEQCEVYRFASDRERDQQLHSMVLGFGFKTEELIADYVIESSEDAGPLRDELAAAGRDAAAAVLLHLMPLPDAGDTSPFTHLKLWIDKDTLLPEKVWFEDYNGDKTTIEIRTIDLNTAVEPSRFAPSFPPGTEFIDKTES